MPLECRIELNKKDGVTVTVIGEDTKKTQVIRLDGDKVTITVKDGSNTSTYVQMPDSISMKCKTFSVDAEVINTKSTKRTLVVSDGDFTVNSKDKLALNGSSDVAVVASKALDLTASTLTAKGTTSATVQSQTVTVKGDSKATLTAATTEVKGSSATNIDGMTVNIKASTTMNVQGMTTNVKGQMTNVKGSLVSLG
jgi:hypothetical protein